MPRTAQVPAFLCMLGLSASMALAAIGCDSAAPPPHVAAHSDKPRADCYACHARDYQQAHRHVNVKPTRCAVCHLETAWHPTQLNHPWPLTGAHAKANCFDCHKGSPPEFERTDKACVACHRDDYDKSDYPGHDKFALTCADCHSTNAWKPAKKPTKRAREEPEPSPPSAAPPANATEPARRSVSTERVARPKPSSTKAPAPTAAARKDTKAPTQPKSVSPKPSATQSTKAVSTAAAKPKHPESAFPITTGNHTDIECETCHDQPGKMGKANTDCVQCHKRSKYDRKHTRVTDYPAGAAAPNFCVNCHTRGTVKPIARSR